MCLEISVGNSTTNLAEAYMHVCCKFDGEKQINRSQSGSWEARCAGAALRVNEGPEWGPICWEKITKLTINHKKLAKDNKHKTSEEVRLQ